MYGATIPCGMIRFTCEKYPTVTYMNAQMRTLLGVTNENLGLLEYLRDNIFFMFPQEEREHFREQLDAVEQQGDVVACRHRISCCDGTIVAVSGWLSKVTDQAGNAEYQAVYSEKVSGEEKPQEMCVQNMVHMLTGKYDAVFAVDFRENIVCCLKVNEYHISGEIQGIRMILEDAVKCWVCRLVLKEDQEKVVVFLKNFNERQEECLEFRTLDKNGKVRNYCSEFLFINQKTMLFCCREMQKEALAVQMEGPETRKILIRTFGNFDIFIDGKAIHFSNRKAKEFLAILVDRRGGFVTRNEAISLMWEDACGDKRTGEKFRKAVMDLRKTLRKHKIGDMLVKTNQESRLNMEGIECDLYQYLEEGDKYSQLFQGEYMSNYSWGENTLGGLVNKKE